MERNLPSIATLADLCGLQELKMDRHRQCVTASERFVQSFIKLQATASSDKVVADIMSFKRDNICARTGAKDMAQVLTSLCNHDPEYQSWQALCFCSV
jgi:hypothetical protein